MAIDPRLALGIQPPQIQSFLDPIMKAKQMQAMDQRNMLLDRNLQKEDAAEQRKNMLSGIVASAYENNRLNPGLAAQKLAEKGLGDEALQLSDMEREQQKEARLQQKDKIESLLNILDAQQKITLGSSQETWETRDRPLIVEFAKQMNPDIDDIPEKNLPHQWNPELVSRALEQSKTAQQRLTEQHQQTMAELQRDSQEFKQQVDIAKLGMQDKALEENKKFREKQLQQQDKKIASSIGINKSLPTGQAKQVIGVSNLSDAIDEYTKQLDKFSLGDLASPDARAAMGTKYNNMMLQAKEAYNLGVLNGPDYDILTSVITDPRSIKGAITSNDALKGQALELKRMMNKIGSTASKTYKGGNQMPNQQTSGQQPPADDWRQDPEYQEFLKEYNGGQ